MNQFNNFVLMDSNPNTQNNSGVPVPPPQQTQFPAATAQSGPTFASLVNSAKSILVVLPLNPDFDQTAAGVSLFLSLKKIKPVSIYSPSPMTVEFNRLISVDKVSQQIGNKNMLIRFVNYDAQNIEKVSFDVVENNICQLTVVPIENATPPNKDQAVIEYAGISADMVIIISGENESNFPIISQQELINSNVIHIGTKQVSLSTKKNYLSFTRMGSSVSEIVYGLIRENQMFIDSDIATNLLMGIEEVVGDGFVGEGITAETFYTIADLMQYGGKRHSNKGVYPSDFPPGAIPHPQINKQVPQNADIQQQNQDLTKQSPFLPENKEAWQAQSAAADDNQTENPPEDWLKKPKVYKGSDSNNF